MKSKLIIVDGHSSVGKSSISKRVYQQLALQQEAYWVHEESENHSIRHNEFQFGGLDTVEGMELNRVGMLQKWAEFRDSILASGKICIAEGCFLHAYDRYFVHSVWDEDDIVKYSSQVLEILGELHPVIVLLHRPNLRISLEKAFIARGQWWRELILKRDDLHVYFKNHKYVDENSMFAAIDYEQAKIMEIYNQLPGSKMRVDTSEENWEQYVEEIITFLGATYEEIKPNPCKMEQYAGTYHWQHGGETHKWQIHYDAENNRLYTSLFWDYMPMRCVAENVLELISFPVELHFEQSKAGLQFRIRGNYDWEYNEKVFVRE